jgi:hypothetical protein
MEQFDFFKHLQRQRDFSEKTFGPGQRSQGVVDHIRKELEEILAKPDDLEECYISFRRCMALWWITTTDH